MQPMVLVYLHYLPTKLGDFLQMLGIHRGFVLELDRWPGAGNVPTGWPGRQAQDPTGISTMDRQVEKLG